MVADFCKTIFKIRIFTYSLLKRSNKGCQKEPYEMVRFDVVMSCKTSLEVSDVAALKSCSVLGFSLKLPNSGVLGSLCPAMPNCLHHNWGEMPPTELDP